ncbi:transposase [Streptomyces sp. NPDC051020]|uniref:transposase n=1 Tax=Streptomyces sp. NPDC051020 TaxID=3155409 RepID=UPI00343D667A
MSAFLFPTAPHDGGALFPDDSGDRKSGHATAYVSRQYPGSRGQVQNGMVATTTARADERVHYPSQTIRQMRCTSPSGPTSCRPRRYRDAAPTRTDNTMQSRQTAVG